MLDDIAASAVLPAIHARVSEQLADVLLHSYGLPGLLFVDQVPDSWLQSIAGYHLFVRRADLLAEDDAQGEGLNAADEVEGGCGTQY